MLIQPEPVAQKATLEPSYQILQDPVQLVEDEASFQSVAFLERSTNSPISRAPDDVGIKCLAGVGVPTTVPDLRSGSSPLV